MELKRRIEGTLIVEVDGRRTAVDIPFNATAAEMQASLERAGLRGVLLRPAASPEERAAAEERVAEERAARHEEQAARYHLQVALMGRLRTAENLATPGHPAVVLVTADDAAFLQRAILDAEAYAQGEGY